MYQLLDVLFQLLDGDVHLVQLLLLLQQLLLLLLHILIRSEHELPINRDLVVNGVGAAFVDFLDLLRGGPDGLDGI